MGFFKPLQRWRTSNFREKAQTAKAGRYGVVPTFFANLTLFIALKQRSKNELQPVTNNPQHAQAV
jgi:hypothetical protein